MAYTHFKFRRKIHGSERSQSKNGYIYKGKRKDEKYINSWSLRLADARDAMSTWPALSRTWDAGACPPACLLTLKTKTPADVQKGKKTQTKTIKPSSRHVTQQK